MLHLREFLEEPRLHRPVFEVIRILEEDLGHFIPIVLRIKSKDVAIGEGPVEVEVLHKRGAEVPCRRVFLVLEYQPIA